MMYCVGVVVGAVAMAMATASKSISGMEEESLHSYGDRLPNGCVGKEDGDYWLLLSDESSDYLPVKLTCNNEYVILDLSKDSNLQSYFSSYEMWHHSIAGPSNNDPVNWQEWFLKTRLNEGNVDSKYVLSPDCSTCEVKHQRQLYETHTTYWMTGNLAKLHWGIIGFNECDMDYDTYECYNCESCTELLHCDPVAYDELTTDYDNSGICGVTVQDASREVYHDRWFAQQQTNYKPSIGTSGEFCVCYQQSKHLSLEYALTDEQENIIAEKEDSDSEESSTRASWSNMKTRENTRTQDVSTSVTGLTTLDASEDSDGSDGSDGSDAADARDSNIVYLTQSDFEKGTYRIKESGTYIISEDIEFDFGNDNDYWPKEEDSDIYDGAYSTRGAYHLGFFAGITIECDYVTIDLNSKELRQSTKFYFQQRWFVIIELGNQQFLPGQGPAFFGHNPTLVSYVTIKNGVLGRASHMGIHGNFPTNVVVKDVHIKDFATHGLQFNGWTGLEMENIEIGPSSTIEYLRGDYGHGRILLQRLEMIEKDLESLNINYENDMRYKVKFANHGKAQSIEDIYDELELQMGYALEYAMNRVENKYEDNDYINPEMLSTSEDKERWLKAKAAFVHESGIPSASSITGMFLNFQGASVFAYATYTTHASSNGVLKNIYIHDIQHDFYESMRLTLPDQPAQVYPSPWNSDIPMEHIIGGKQVLKNLRDSLDSGMGYEKYKYVGSALSDAYFYLGSVNIPNDWGYLGFMETVSFETSDNGEVDIRSDLLDWVEGKDTIHEDWVFTCNQDIMGHSAKGLLGLRMDGVDNVKLDGIVIENLIEQTELGSYACGEYTGFDLETGGGHFRQQYPMQLGFSGNNLQAISIISSTNVEIDGVTEISNLENYYSHSWGLSLWTANDVTIKENSLIKMKNIKSGTELDEESLGFALTKTTYPNRSPEACGVRLQHREDFEEFKTTLSFESGNSKSNIIICDIAGNSQCPTSFDSYKLFDTNNDDDASHTMFGGLYEDGTTCDAITTKDKLSDLIDADSDADADDDNNEMMIVANSRKVDSVSSLINSSKLFEYGAIVFVLLLIGMMVVQYKRKFSGKGLSYSGNNDEKECLASKGGKYGAIQAL